MWIVAAVSMWIPVPGWLELPPDHEIMNLYPAGSEEACHIQAIDRVMESWEGHGLWEIYREKGFIPFINVTCEKST